MKLWHVPRGQLISPAFQILFIALFEPWDVGHVVSDSSWVNAMPEELENFERNHVWTLVDPPIDVNVIGTKGVLRTNRGRMVRLWGTRLALLLKGIVR
jgi:hypothetical protein